MRSQRQDGYFYRNAWIQPLATAATIAVVGAGLLGEPTAVFGQGGFKWIGRKSQPAPEQPAPKPTLPPPAPSGFEKTVRQLMEQSRREAAAGKVDAAIRTAERARKIAEAASPMMGALPDCSPAAADQLYHEMLALRPAPNATATIAAKPSVTAPVVPDVFEEPVPPPQSPVATAPRVVLREVKAAPNGEKWQPQVSSADDLPPPIVAKVIAVPQVEADEVYFPAETAAPVITDSDAEVPLPAVVLGRSYEGLIPVATESGRDSSPSIAGGERAAKVTVRPRPSLPLEADNVPEPKDADPDWSRTDAPLSESTAAATIDESESDTEAQLLRELYSVKTPVEIIESGASDTSSASTVSSQETVTPAKLNPATGWTGSGAVVHKQRIARATSLHTDGWHSPVTRAGGAPVESETKETVSTTAFRSTTANDHTEMLPFASEERLLKAPPPPVEIDEDDVALQSPSVWKREGLATLTTTEPAENHAQSPAWRRFSEWSKSMGWPATSAAIGLAAAVLAIAALALALFPREQRVMK